MRLYHATTIATATQIVREGFTLSRSRDTSGSAWFDLEPERAAWLAVHAECYIVVFMPDSVAEKYRWFLGDDVVSPFCVPHDVVNNYLPFALEDVHH